MVYLTMGIVIIAAVIIIYGIGIHYEKREKQQEDHQEWLKNIRDHLFHIQSDFEADCSKILEKYFEQYMYTVMGETPVHYRVIYWDESDMEILHRITLDYKDKIKELKEEYIGYMNTKVLKRMGDFKFCVNIVPSPLDIEYDRYIYIIADAYIKAGYNMYNYAHLIKSAKEQRTHPRYVRHQSNEE